MDLDSFVHRLMTTRYARELEEDLARERAENARRVAEIARLRGENRALLNSILGIAGIPPVIVSDAAPELSRAAEPASESAAAPLKPREKGKGSAIPPLRRRSWHQLMRGLEIASARKPREKVLP